MVTNIHDLYEKATKVVNSCKDHKQLQGAISYAALFVKLIEREHPENCWMRGKLWHEIQEQFHYLNLL